MTLHSEAQNGTLTRAALQKYLALVSIDAEDANGFTPLALAVKNGYPSVAKLLLQNGAKADKKVRDGRTPLYLAANAKQNRPRVVQLLLAHHPPVDASSDEWGNETPLMVAITQARDPEVIKLLVEAGASLTKQSDRGDTAQSLADQSSNPAIKNALLPKDQQNKGKVELTSFIVNFVLFVLAYFDSWNLLKDIILSTVRSLYNLTSAPSGGGSQTGEDIENPQTVEDFKKNLDNMVAQNGLDDFFPPGDPYLQKVAEKAVELKNDPNNLLKSPSEIRDITQLALYQPILYCDDSGSMEGSGMQAQTALVKRMASIMTRAVPAEKGVHLRFINRDDSRANNLNASTLEQRMSFTPAGDTRIGTNLINKVLQPFIYNVFNRGEVLERPYLILTITDGCPNDEEPDTFRNAVVNCGKTIVNKGYQLDAVRFSLSQIGTSAESEEFLDGLEGDSALDDVLHRTSDRLDEKYDELKDNEKELEQWLLQKLIAPIKLKK